MNVDELRRWISSEFWKSSQLTTWAERTFYRRKVHQQTNRGTSSGTQPIVTLPTGYVDPSFYDLSAYTGAAQFVDNVFTLVDNDDATKKLQLQLSGITTATTRTITVPDANFTLVGVALAQTLTNKTLTTPVISATGFTNAQHAHTGSTSGGELNQYAALAGRSGGQTLYGGTASGNTLALYTTSNATKGVMNLAGVMYVDEVNGRVGIGVASPLNDLSVVTNDGGTAVVIDAASTAYDATGGIVVVRDDTDREIVIGGLGMFRRDGNVDNGDLRFNFIGYNGGTTRYRDFKIYDGKSNVILTVDGSAGTVEATGNIIAAGINVGEDTITRYNDVTSSGSPTITAATAPSSVTYTTRQGYYERLNKAVTIQYRISWSGITGGSGELRIPLPFTAYSSGPQIFAGFHETLGVVSVIVGTSGTYATLYTSAGAVAISTSSGVSIGGTYFIA